MSDKVEATLIICGALLYPTVKVCQYIHRNVISPIAYSWELKQHPEWHPDLVELKLTSEGLYKSDMAEKIRQVTVKPIPELWDMLEECWNDMNLVFAGTCYHDNWFKTLYCRNGKDRSFEFPAKFTMTDSGFGNVWNLAFNVFRSC